MKRSLLTTLALTLCLTLSAQRFVGFSPTVTLYQDYRPARITLSSGKVIMQKQANVFLKNGRLLFRNGKNDMQANMAQIRSVEFADCSFVRMDTMLAAVLDTLGHNRVLRTTTIDLEAYQETLVNGRIFSHFELGGEQVGFTASEAVEGDEGYPLIHTYYLDLDGKIVPLHERTVRRMLPKSKKEQFDIYLQMPDFDLCSPDYLHKILELFAE